MADRLKAHPAADVFPMMEPSAFEEFKEDIKRNGLIEPIWLHDGMILDGRNRYRACLDLGIEPKFQPYNGNSPVAFVCSVNVARRHLTHAQRADIALALLPMFREEARRRQAQAEGQPRGNKQASLPPRVEEQTGEAAAQAARAVGVSKSSVYQAKKIQSDDPELYERVKSGEISVGRANNIINGRARVRERAKTRAEQITELASQGHRSEQIAEELGVTVGHIRNVASANKITLPDQVIGKAYKINANRVIEETVYGLSGYAQGVELLRGGIQGIDPGKAEAWAASIAESLRSINWLKKQLTEIAHG